MFGDWKFHMLSRTIWRKTNYFHPVACWLQLTPQGFRLGTIIDFLNLSPHHMSTNWCWPWLGLSTCFTFGLGFGRWRPRQQGRSYGIWLHRNTSITSSYWQGHGIIRVIFNHPFTTFWLFVLQVAAIWRNPCIQTKNFGLWSGKTFWNNSILAEIMARCMSCCPVLSLINAVKMILESALQTAPPCQATRAAGFFSLSPSTGSIDGSASYIVLQRWQKVTQYGITSRSLSCINAIYPPEIITFSLTLVQRNASVRGAVNRWWGSCNSFRTFGSAKWTNVFRNEFFFGNNVSHGTGTSCGIGIGGGSTWATPSSGPASTSCPGWAGSSSSESSRTGSVRTEQKNVG